MEQAVEIAVREVMRSPLDRVIFACFGADVYAAYDRAVG